MGSDLPSSTSDYEEGKMNYSPPDGYSGGGGGGSRAGSSRSRTPSPVRVAYYRTYSHTRDGVEVTWAVAPWPRNPVKHVGKKKVPMVLPGKCPHPFENAVACEHGGDHCGLCKLHLHSPMGVDYKDAMGQHVQFQ